MTPANREEMQEVYSAARVATQVSLAPKEQAASGYDIRLYIQRPPRMSSRALSMSHSPNEKLPSLA